jgi:hypothetical protein
MTFCVTRLLPEQLALGRRAGAFQIPIARSARPRLS